MHSQILHNDKARALLGIRIRGLRKGPAYEFNKGMADQTGFRDFGRACHLTFWFRKGHGLSRFVVAHEFAHYARYVNDIESDSPDDERETSKLARALLKCARAED